MTRQKAKKRSRLTAPRTRRYQAVKPVQQAKQFHFTTQMDRLCRDICNRLDVFEHIHMDQVAVTFAQSRTAGIYGVHAKLTPLRFEGGTLTTKRSGQEWSVQRVYVGEFEMLYLLTFYLPRFQNHTFREKMITLVHELYHISPQFDGDIRRFPGRYHAHSSSQCDYDRLMDDFVEEYLSFNPPQDLFQFLENDFQQLSSQHGSIVGLRLPMPKMIPLN